MGGHLSGMGAKPAFARSAFTVLFGMPILRHDVLRGQGNDLRLAVGRADTLELDDRAHAAVPR